MIFTVIPIKRSLTTTVVNKIWSVFLEKKLILQFKEMWTWDTLMSHRVRGLPKGTESSVSLLEISIPGTFDATLHGWLLLTGLWLAVYHSVHKKCCLWEQGGYMGEMDRVRMQPVALLALIGWLYFFCISINCSILKKIDKVMM